MNGNLFLSCSYFMDHSVFQPDIEEYGTVIKHDVTRLSHTIPHQQQHHHHQLSRHATVFTSWLALSAQLFYESGVLELKEIRA